MKPDQFSDLEKGKLFAFCQDKAMFDAVKKVMLQDIYYCGTGNAGADTINWAYNLVYGVSPVGGMTDNGKTNDELGESLRGTVMGLTYLNNAFKRIEDFNVTLADQKPATNPAI